MALHKLAPIPQGFTVAQFAGQFYPLAIEMNEYPYVRMYTFARGQRGTVSYSKRSLAVQFLQKFAQGEGKSSRIDRPLVEGQ